MKKRHLLVAIILCSFLFACSEQVPVPKPQAYLRVELPAKSYQLFDSTGYPYRFNYPTYAQLKFPPAETAGGDFFLTMDFPSLNGVIYFSYKAMKGKEDLLFYMDTCTEFISMHYQKASGVLEKSYTDEEKKVYATVFQIKGVGVATPYQFWITDSLHHFFRGVLYFKEVPNVEKQAPAINFIATDIEHLINTFDWKATQ